MRHKSEASLIGEGHSRLIHCQRAHESLERGFYANTRSTVEVLVGKRQPKCFGSVYTSRDTWS
jgi:hypothetical protein